jgi:hypothetical protein
VIPLLNRGQIQMLTSIVWIGDALMAAILFRAYRAKLLGKYPFFYAYIASILVTGILLGTVYYPHSATYKRWYLAMNYPTMLLGCGIILEIFHHALGAYPGASRVARISGAIVFGFIFCYAMVYPSWMAPLTSAGTAIELERDLRTVQAIFLFGLLGIISYYGIVVGKNVKGMAMGYGLFIGTSLISAAMRSYIGPSFYPVSSFVQPFSYVVCLCIWTNALWSYQPNPAPDSTVRLEADYEVFVTGTKEMLGVLRSHFGKAVR